MKEKDMESNEKDVELVDVELINDTTKATENFKSNKFFQNQFIKRIINSFKLTTHKITLIVLFLTLTVSVSLLEIPTFFNDFLTIDFGTTIVLLSVFVVGMPYALLIAIVAPWLHLIIPHTVPPNVIGEISYMLSSISVLIVFFTINSVLWFVVKNSNNLKIMKYNADNNWKIRLIIDISSSILAVIIISLLNVFYNWAFILDLYGSESMKSLLWILFFPYNLFKFTLVFILFCLLKKPLLGLKNQFNL